ncbi:MAG: DUF2878 family protein [Deltaproteobacteria bacterium]|nr:DUF2878 family protein [Deltaproteobacteria bacterium]
MWTSKKLAIAFALGGLGGLVLDQIHVRFGVLGYPSSLMFGQPWWVGPNFGFGLLLMLQGSVSFVRGPATRTHPSSFVVGGVCFVAAYLATGLFYTQPWLLLLGLMLAFIPRLVLEPGRSSRSVRLAHALVLGFSGAAYEGALSSFGIFSYARPDVALVPIWLPALYLHGSPILLDVTFETLVRADRS